MLTHGVTILFSYRLDPFYSYYVTHMEYFIGNCRETLWLTEHIMMNIMDVIYAYKAKFKDNIVFDCV